MLDRPIEKLSRTYCYAGPVMANVPALAPVFLVDLVNQKLCLYIDR